MMDFLTLFGIYVAVVLTCIFLVCKYSGQQNNPFNALLSYVTQVSYVHFVSPSNQHLVALLDHMCCIQVHLFSIGSGPFHSSVASEVFTLDFPQTVSSKVCFWIVISFVYHLVFALFHFSFCSFQEQHFHISAYLTRRLCVCRVHLWGVWLLPGDGHQFDKFVGALPSTGHQDLLLLPLHQNRSRFTSVSLPSYKNKPWTFKSVLEKQ